jgi:hypothetical protein
MYCQRLPSSQVCLKDSSKDFELACKDAHQKYNLTEDHLLCILLWLGSNFLHFNVF